MNFAEAVAGDVGVDFGGGDAGVAEEFLDDAEVRAVLEQMRGEAVSEHVRGDVARNAGHPVDALFDAATRELGSRQTVCRDW